MCAQPVFSPHWSGDFPGVVFVRVFSSSNVLPPKLGWRSSQFLPEHARLPRAVLNSETPPTTPSPPGSFFRWFERFLDCSFLRRTVSMRTFRRYAASTRFGSPRRCGLTRSSFISVFSRCRVARIAPRRPPPLQTLLFSLTFL